MAKRRTGQPRVERGSGNVFADIGLPDAEEHLVKASLASRIDDIIGHRRLSQVKAAALAGLKQPDVSPLLSGDFRDFLGRAALAPPAARAAFRSWRREGRSRAGATAERFDHVDYDPILH